MNIKDERKELSHESILASAARLLRQKGIAGARVADVMQGAGLTVGGFYAHFASKAELVDETLRRTGAELLRRLFWRIEEKPPEARAEVLLKRYLSAAHRDLKEDGCPLPSVAGEVGTTAPEHQEVLREIIEAVTAGLQAELPAAHALGRRQLALGLAALMVGGLSLSRAMRDTPLSDEILKACRALGIYAARRLK
jgi:TetR/AcrR family transcriptional repressor of nem operon